MAATGTTAVTKPQAYAPAPTGNATIDGIQQAVKQTTQAARAAPPPRQVVTGLQKNRPNQGVTFKPGQIVDIPHQLGRLPAGFNIAKILTNGNASSAMPSASPNLQLVTVAGNLGQKVMRLRYVAPAGSTESVRLHLELF
jgi:hypothetical protein